MMSSSAQDFEGLMYRLLGKGKQGDADMKWVEDNLLKPFNRANNAISADRVSTMNEFQEMKKRIVKAGIPKNLRKEIPGEPFSIEQAVRVYTWNKQGMEIPGLSKADLKTMVDYVESKPVLMKFSNELIDLGKGEGYQKPGQSWEAGTITTDLLKSINLYFLFTPPPILLDVIRPWLFLPPVDFLELRSDLSGFDLVISLKSPETCPLIPGVTGLIFFDPITKPQKPL